MNPMNAYHRNMNQAHEQHVDLRQIDLNLLVALDALTDERSVTRAAERMGRTQSAMSHALARLRTLLGDPLLVRAQSGMALTPRGEQLQSSVRIVLRDVGRILSGPPEFDPASSRRAFCLASPDLVDLLFISRLLRRFTECAPHAQLSIVSVPPRIDEPLESGEIDLAVAPSLFRSDAPFGPQAEPHLMRRTLTRDGFRAYLRADHPLAKAPRLGKKRYLELGHVLVSPSGRGPGLVDAIVASEGKSRHVALRVSNFSSALRAVLHSDLVLTAPAVLAQMDEFRERFASFSVPFELPEHLVSVVWHQRFDADPAGRWFRELVSEVMSV